MIEILKRKIIAGDMKLEDVPAQIKEDVIKALKAAGYEI